MLECNDSQMQSMVHCSYNSTLLCVYVLWPFHLATPSTILLQFCLFAVADALKKIPKWVCLAMKHKIFWRRWGLLNIWNSIYNSCSHSRYVTRVMFEEILILSSKSVNDLLWVVAVHIVGCTKYHWNNATFYIYIYIYIYKM